MDKVQEFLLSAVSQVGKASRKEFIPTEKKAFLLKLLDVMDSLERIISFGSQSITQEPNPSPNEHTAQYEGEDTFKNWLTSIDGTRKRLLNVFNNIGISCIDCIGEKVNLDRHEIVGTKSVSNSPNGIIVEVLQKGYLLKDNVLRDAKVIVVKN